MKKFYALLSLILLSFCFILTGCKDGLPMPKSDAIVVGNSGFVAQKGEYIYFANAYTGYNTLNSGVTNKEGDVVEYGLYRVKVKDIQTKEIEFDENGYAKNVETVVSKVVGFENSNFYIVGDYLYFSSPSMHKNSSNETMYDLISIFRVKLDGTGLKEVYYTRNATNGDFAIFNFDGKDYLITVEGEEVIKHELTKSGVDNKKVLVSDLTSTILVDEIKKESDKKLVYLTKRSQADIDAGVVGNVMKSVNLQTGQVEVLSDNVGETITLVSRKNGALIYSKNDSQGNTYHYVKDFDSQDKKIISISGVSNAVYLDSNLPIVFKYQNKLVMQQQNSIKIEVLVDENVTILFTNGNYVYYSNSTGIGRANTTTKQSEMIAEVTGFQANAFDFDGRYIYFFNTTSNDTTKTKYIQRIDTYLFEQSQTIVSPEVFANLLEDDKKTDEK